MLAVLLLRCGRRFVRRPLGACDRMLECVQKRPLFSIHSCRALKVRHKSGYGY